jgi:hypothetical protein
MKTEINNGKRKAVITSFTDERVVPDIGRIPEITSKFIKAPIIITPSIP